MKKYLFGLGALMLAIASVAFTTTTDRYFEFQGVNDSELNIPGEWVEITAPLTTCEESDITTCYVKVQDMTLSQFKSNIVPNLTEHDDLFDYGAVVDQKTRD